MLKGKLPTNHIVRILPKNIVSQVTPVSIFRLVPAPRNQTTPQGVRVINMCVQFTMQRLQTSKTVKRRVRHCNSAVPRDSHNPVNSKYVSCNSVKIVQSKFFVNNQKMYDCSKNWRADFHRFKGSTYAQVVKGKAKVSPNQAKSKAKVQFPANPTNHKGEA